MNAFKTCVCYTLHLIGTVVDYRTARTTFLNRERQARAGTCTLYEVGKNAQREELLWKSGFVLKGIILNLT